MYAYLFRRHPFIRILMALILGISLESVFSPSLELLLIVSSGVITLCVILKVMLHRTIWRRPLEGLILLMILVILGAVLSTLEKKSIDLAFREIREGKYMLQIEDIPYLKNDKVRARAFVYACDSLGNHYRSKLQISMEADSLSKMLRPGDLIFASIKPMRINSDGIPEGFDYAAYLRKQAIWFQASIKKEEWTCISGDSIAINSSFLQEVALIRHSLIRKMSAGGLDPPVQAFIAALVLGYKRDLDPQLKEQFTSIGVVHVLAVSGLHIGIIYWVLQKVFFFLLLIRGGRYLNFFVVLGFLWFYVFLAGFSPSVLRAAFMFSLVQTARLINRNSSVFNVLAASAFILLVFSPSTLFDLGFLFSYLAVAGILLLQPVLLSFLEFKSRIFTYLYSMMALSLSAQLLVTPLSIYYFHQFPFVFILANLVMVPIVVAYIYPASLLLLLPAGSYISVGLESILGFGYRLIEWLSSFFESFPMAKLENIPFDNIQLVLWYLFLVFLLIFITLRIPRSALILMIILLALIGNNWYGKFKAERQSEMMVFYYQTDWWIVLIEGRQATTLSQQPSDSVVHLKLRNYLLSRRIENKDFICISANDTASQKNIEITSKSHFRESVYSDGLSDLYSSSDKYSEASGDCVSQINDRIIKVGTYLFWRDQIIHLAFLEKGKKNEMLFEEVDYTIGGFARDSLPGQIKQITRYPSRLGIPVHAASSDGAFFMKL